MEDKGGAIPSNFLSIPNTESNSQYLRYCQLLNVKGHPARFPPTIPEFFIRLLTETGDTVLDIFAGSNTTGEVAESLERNWIAFELEQEYLAASVFRFLDKSDAALAQCLYDKLSKESASNIAVPQTGTRSRA
jgi:site-specific DNA-methyltransferase (cytosine-N4-specific)